MISLLLFIQDTPVAEIALDWKTYAGIAALVVAVVGAVKLSFPKWMKGTITSHPQGP